MIDALFAGLTSFSGLFYGILVPLLLAVLFALVLIPSLQQSGARPRAVIRACYEYLMLGAGILLMTVGALPTIFSVLAGVPYAGNVYFALLLMFAVGGGVFLWHDQRVRTLDTASRAVPGALYFYVVKIIGQLTMLLAFLSFSVSLVLGDIDGGFWVMPLVLGTYGALLAWTTRTESPTTSSAFQSISMPSMPVRPLRPVMASAPKPSVAAKPMTVKPVAAKPSKKAKKRR